MDDRAKELQGTGGETDAMRRAPATPGVSRQIVRGGADQDAAARPGGATQNSGGALVSSDEDTESDSERAAE